jgi:hypothetical protein
MPAKISASTTPCALIGPELGAELFVIPSPLATESPVFIELVLLVVVVALVDFGALLILLVLVPMIKELPSLARLIRVPETVITAPGVNVVPEPKS